MASSASRLALCLAFVVSGTSLDAAAKAADPYLPYGGVSLKGGEPPSPKPPPAGYQYINWPGFRVAKDSPTTEVFLQLTGPVQYKVKQRGRRVYVVLDKVQVYLKNNFRTMFTQHFKRQPVSRFKLRQLKGDKIRLEISLLRRAKATVELKTIGQYTYLVVSFPNRK